MVHLEFGQDRLTQPHPLHTFEVAQSAIEVSFKGGFVAEQVIELRCKRNLLAKHLQLHPFRFYRGARFLCNASAAETADLPFGGAVL